MPPTPTNPNNAAISRLFVQPANRSKALAQQQQGAYAGEIPMIDGSTGFAAPASPTDRIAADFGVLQPYGSGTGTGEWMTAGIGYEVLDNAGNPMWRMGNLLVQKAGATYFQDGGWVLLDASGNVIAGYSESTGLFGFGGGGGGGTGPFVAGDGTNSAILAGSTATATGAEAVALGDGAQADGDNSLAIGTGSLATDAYSLAIGDLATTFSAAEFAQGGGRHQFRRSLVSTFITAPNSEPLSNASAGGPPDGGSIALNTRNSESVASIVTGTVWAIGRSPVEGRGPAVYDGEMGAWEFSAVVIDTAAGSDVATILGFTTTPIYTSPDCSFSFSLSSSAPGTFDVVGDAPSASTSVGAWFYATVDMVDAPGL